MKQKICSDVSVVRCSGYDARLMQNAVKRAVDLLGGIGSFVKPGDRVLIKPNLLKASSPDRAVITHPEMIRTVIRIVHEAGAKAMVGDSPGFGDLRTVCEKSGVMNVIEEEGAVLADFEPAMKITNRGRFHHFEISRAVRDADAIINLPKLKTHGMMSLTGAVKNLFGCVPGKRKVQWHFNAGVNSSAFARMLVELCALLKTRLTIMDAIVGMDGNGPGSGDPFPIGLVLAGQDPVAVDAISGTIVGADPAHLPLLRAAADAGIGEPRPGRITVHGEAISDVMITNFKFPPQAHLEWRIPEWVRRLLKGALTTRPIIDHQNCIRCGICQRHWPQGTISPAGKRFKINYRDCIRCFCCQEFCPQGAITVGRGWALKIVK